MDFVGFDLISISCFTGIAATKVEGVAAPIVVAQAPLVLRSKQIDNVASQVSQVRNKDTVPIQNF